MSAAPAAAAPPVMSARGIGVSFGGLRALDGVDIDVAPGSIVGVIGPNGAGKTTLFDCLSGFIPCEGDVWVRGVHLTHLPPHRRAAAGLGRSFQDARLFHSMTVLDTIRVAYEPRARASSVMGTVLRLPGSRRAEREATEKALELIELFGLAAYRDKLIRELSTGTRRIVDLACVLTQEPAVVMLDEPSSGIAQREAEALGPLLRTVRDRTGCALLLIEHDMPLLLGLAERVYALETGRVIAEGAPGDVVHDPEVVRSYLGADPAAIARSGAVAPSKDGRGSGRAKRSPARADGRKAAAKKTPSKKAPSKKVPGKRSPVKKAAAGKAAAGKAAAAQRARTTRSSKGATG